MEIRLGAVAEAAAAMTRMVAMPNTAEAAVLEVTTMTLALVPLAVHLCMVEEAVVQDAVMVEPAQQERVGHGEVIPQAAGVLAEVVTERLEQRQMTVNLEQAMAVVAENLMVVPVVQEPPQAVEAVEQVAEPVAPEAQAAMEPEARCEYGPGDSKYSRTIWSGCAEA